MTENVVYDGPVEEKAPGSREVPGSNPGWMTMTEQSNSNIADHLAKQVDDIQDVPGMKAVLMKMVEVIKRQDDVIYQLKGKLNKTEERSIDNTNSIHQLNERVTEVEKYSRKLCLIFTNLQQKGTRLQVYYIYSVKCSSKHECDKFSCLSSTKSTSKRAYHCKIYLPCG